MENDITYIPMDDDFRNALRERYYTPLRKNIIFLTIVAVILYAIVVFGAISSAKDGMLEFESKKAVPVAVPIAALCFWLAITLGFFYAFGLTRFLGYKICYKKDAEFGQIMKERAHISDVIYTPAGINIYWLDSASILTFTPDPCRHFGIGDPVTIYYLKYSKEYLSYEV